MCRILSIICWQTKIQNLQWQCVGQNCATKTKKKCVMLSSSNAHVVQTLMHRRRYAKEAISPSIK